MKSLTGLNIPVRLTDPPPPSDGITIYSKSGVVYSIDSAGLIEVITNIGSGGTGTTNDHVDIALESGENLLAYKLVTTDTAGNAIYADSGNLNHVNRVVGVTKSSANLGNPVVVRHKGLLSNSGWAFVPNQLLYLGTNGDVTANPNSGLLNNIIGYAVSETTIFINIGRSIVRG